MRCLHNRHWPLCMAVYIQIQSCLGNHEPRKCNSCERNENIMLHKSAPSLSLFLSPVPLVPACAEIYLCYRRQPPLANNYWSDHKTVMSDSVSNTQGRKRADPVPCVHDGLPAVCTVSSGETVVCSFLSQSLRRKSCLWLKLSSPLWTIQPPDIKKHRSTKLYKSHALNNVCVCVHPHVQLCVCVFVALVPLLEAWLIF